MLEAAFSDSFIEELWGGGGARHPENLGFIPHDICTKDFITHLGRCFGFSIGSIG